MSTKTITICSTCGKKSCDGGIWKMIDLYETTWEAYHHKLGKCTYTQVDLDTIPEENKTNCTLGWGKQKLLKNKNIGDKIILEYPNWASPAMVTLIKI